MTCYEYFPNYALRKRISALFFEIHSILSLVNPNKEGYYLQPLIVSTLPEQTTLSRSFENILHHRFFAWGIALYLGLHVLYFVLPSLPFANDSLSYYRWAEENVKSGTLYPSKYNVHLQEEAIVTPVYINMEVVALTIWNDPKAIYVLNALLNLGQLALVYLVALRLFGEGPAVVGGCLYMLYLNNLGLVLVNYTEMAFGFFVLLSVYIFFTRQTNPALFLSGLILGLAIGVRPTGMAALIAYLLMVSWDMLHRRWEVRKSLTVAVGLCVYVIAAGLYTQHSVSDFAFMSATGPGNILLGANDQANGQYNVEELNMPESKIQSYKERNQALSRHAFDWIRAHPFQWISTFPRKIYSTYISDDFAVSQLLLDPDWTFNRYVKDVRTGRLEQFESKPIAYKTAFLVLNVYHQLFYMLLVAAFLLQALGVIRGKTLTRNEALLYLFIFVGFCMTVVGTIGSLRYKYNFLIAAIILCSPYFAKLSGKWFKSSSSNLSV